MGANPVGQGDGRAHAAETGPVLLVDDHVLVAVSLAAALERAGIELVTIDPSPTTDVVAVAREHGCTLVLLDLDLGEGQRGVDRIPALVAAGCRVVVLSGTDDRLELAAAFEAGAIGYIAKRSTFEDLVDGVRRAVRGSLHHPAEIERLQAQLRVVRERDAVLQALFDRLTESERHVLDALARGRTAREIAQDQVVAISTIRTHIRGVLTKLDVRNQAAAIALARDAGWDNRGDGQNGTSSA
jgi:DNA-binding NarL/FixJ family response regulator